MQKDDKEVPRNFRLGIIIPCYNHGKYLCKCINTVENQSFEGIDHCIYISNEKSTDNSKEVILSLAQDFLPVGENLYFSEKQKIAFYDNPNPRGPSAARNNLIKLGIQNDAFAMLDADDYYLPGKIKKSIDILKSDIENIGIVYSDAIILNDMTGRMVNEFREPYSFKRIRQECIISNTPIINKKALEACGLYDETMRTAEDWDLWIRISKKFISIHIPEPLHVYRVTGKNASDVVPKEIWQQNWQKIRERVNGSN